MKICVLQPSYEGSSVEYGNYDPPRDLTSLLPAHEVTHVFLKKATVYSQLKRLRRDGIDVFVNLCEGYLDWDIPSIDVIHALTTLNAAFTGSNADLYDPSKTLMKLVAWYAGVPTPRSVTIKDVAGLTTALTFPVFAKPDQGGDSRGIDERSLCHDYQALSDKVQDLLEIFDTVVVDEYIDGREFSVLVAADPSDTRTPLTLRPVEFRFDNGAGFKTEDLKVRQYHPDSNVPCDDPALTVALMDAAKAIFTAFRGVGYCRMDFRVDADNRIYFLDANFACSIFYAAGAYGTADYILQHDGFGAERFLRHIIDEALARHAAAQKPYAVRGNAIAGYGISAERKIVAGDVVFRGEERYQRLATRDHVRSTWSRQEQGWFLAYAYPVGTDTFILWDDRPADWAPQNHSCMPNTAYYGLNVIALRDIDRGEELTLDYATFMNPEMEPFICRCGTTACRGQIRGLPRQY